MLFPDRLPRAHARRAPVRAGRPVDRQECDGRRGMTTPRLNFHTPALRQKRKHSSGRVGRSTPGNPDVCHSSRGPARLPTSEPGAGPSDRCSLLFSPPGLARGGATLVAWHVAFCSRSITRKIANVAATRIAGAVEPLSVDWSSGGSLPGRSGCTTRTTPWPPGSRIATQAGSRPLAAEADVWGGADPCNSPRLSRRSDAPQSARSCR